MTCHCNIARMLNRGGVISISTVVRVLDWKYQTYLSFNLSVCLRIFSKTFSLIPKFLIFGRLNRLATRTCVETSITLASVRFRHTHCFQTYTTHHILPAPPPLIHQPAQPTRYLLFFVNHNGLRINLGRIRTDSSHVIKKQRMASKWCKPCQFRVPWKRMRYAAPDEIYRCPWRLEIFA